jgi:outer membrane protein assembly factor BamB
MYMTYLLKDLVVLTLALALGGCGALNIFSRDQSEQPAELTGFQAERQLRTLWSTNVGNGQGRHYNRLTPAIDGDYIYAAANNGIVTALDKSNGRQHWQVRTRQAISGGVGARQGMVLFGTRDAYIFALSQETGEELWRQRVSSEVLSAPQTDGRVVVAQTVDGKLVGLDPATGEQRWIYESTVPPLTLRGSSDPLITGNLVIAGFPNGIIAALDINNGFLQWEERVAIPQGRYDLERVIDIDGNLLLSSGIVYAASFQGNVMGLDAQSGRIVWGRPASSYNGIAAGLGNLYYVNAESHVLAVANTSDATIWENDALRLRKVGAPRAFGNFIAVGDFEGYLHVLSQINGNFVARTRIDRSGIRAPLLSEGNIIYAFTNGGRLTALRLE